MQVLQTIVHIADLLVVVAVDIKLACFHVCAIPLNSEFRVGLAYRFSPGC